MSDEIEGWTHQTWACDECPQTASAYTQGDITGVRLVHGETQHRLVFPKTDEPAWLDKIPAGVDIQVPGPTPRRR